jgi:hypothetical protein
VRQQTKRVNEEKWIAMGEVFNVEPSPSRLVIDRQGKGRVHFRVRNATDHEVQMRAQVVTEKQADASWFAIDGQSERNLGRGGTATVIVNVAVPEGTKPGSDYGLALQVTDGSDPNFKPERGPGVTMDVNARHTPHGRGLVATVVGSIIGGVIGALLAIILGAYEIGHGVTKGVSSGWTFGHTFTHILTSIFLGLLITFLGALILPWLFEVVGAALALLAGHHWGIRHTMRAQAIITPIWSIVAGAVVVIVFKEIPGKQFILPFILWWGTLVLFPPLIARLTTVAGRQHAR